MHGADRNLLAYSEVQHLPRTPSSNAVAAGVNWNMAIRQQAVRGASSVATVQTLPSDTAKPADTSNTREVVQQHRQRADN